MLVLASLAGVLVACAVYLLLAAESWRQLVGLAFLGNAMALLVVAAGSGAASAIRVAIALLLISFAVFLAYASFVRIKRRGVAATDKERLT